MTIVTILGIMVALGLIVAAVIDLRDRKRRPKNVPMPTRGDLEGGAGSTHYQKIPPIGGGMGGMGGGIGGGV